MKKVVSIVILSFMLASCGTGMATNNNNNNNTSNNSNTVTNVDNKEYQKLSAVEVTAVVRVTESVSGSDTPTDEMSEKVAKITKATLSVFDAKMVLKNTYELKKVDPSTKGEVLKFSADYKGLPTDAANFKFVFSNNDNSVTFETSSKAELKEKTIYKAMAVLEQVSAKKDAAAPETASSSVEEFKADNYVKDEFIFGLKSEFKEEEIKDLLQKNGIKISEFRKGALSNTVKFSEPSSVAEALLIASSLNKFDYVEPNGIVTIMGF